MLFVCPSRQAQRLKADLEALSERHGPLLSSLARNISSLNILIERGLSQQMLADKLMNDVTAARDKVWMALITDYSIMQIALLMFKMRRLLFITEIGITHNNELFALR